MSEPFLESLSRPQPIPGGGAAAAYGACVGLALLEKIVHLELNRRLGVLPKESFWSNLLANVCRLSEALRRLRDEDGRAYMKLAAAKTRGAATEEIMAALREAMECPMEIVEHSERALAITTQAASHCRKHLLSDLLVVCELLSAAGHGAYHITMANIALITDARERKDYKDKLSRIRERLQHSFHKAEEAIFSGIESANEERAARRPIFEQTEKTT